jgi:hypothetical protein
MFAALSGIEHQTVHPARTPAGQAAAVARRLLERDGREPADIDCVISWSGRDCPAAALRDRLGIPAEAGALDIGAGSSGFLHALSLAKNAIECGQATTVLLLAAEAGPEPTAVAALVVAVSEASSGMGQFIFGSVGSLEAALASLPEALDELLAESADGPVELDLLMAQAPDELSAEQLHDGMANPPGGLWVAHDPSELMALPIALRAADCEELLVPDGTVALAYVGADGSWSVGLLRGARALASRRLTPTLL